MLIRAHSFNFPTDIQFGLDIFTSFGPFNRAGGRFGGYALECDNTGFGEKNASMPLDGTDTDFTIGFAWFFFPQGSGADFPSSDPTYQLEMLRLNDSVSGTRLLTLKTRHDRRISVLAGPSLTEIGPTNLVLSMFTWYYFEIRYVRNSTIEIWVDDVLDTSGSPHSTGVSPDTVTWRWANFGGSGWRLDDIYIAEGGGSGDRLGPVWIGSWYMAADTILRYSRMAPGGYSSNAQAIADRFGVTIAAPDDDTSYVQAIIANDIDYYTVNRAAFCRGKILALIANLVAKDGGGGDPTLTPMIRANPSVANDTVIGSFAALTGSYAAYQTFSLLDPDGNVWTDGKIEAAFVGIKASTITARITMFWVEKLASLRNIPYSCGNLGSYVIQRLD